MSTCELCHKSSSQGEEKVVHTARIASKTERVLQSDTTTKVVETTTHFNDFAEHHYFVCSQCRLMRDGIALPAGVAMVLLLTIVLFIASTSLHIAWLFAVALFALILGMGPVSHLGTGAGLNKKALAERGAAIKGIHAFYFTGETEGFKAFNADEYARLQISM